MKSSYFVSFDKLHPGQSRFSSIRVSEKIEKAKSYLNKKGEFRYDDGKSLYPLSKARKAVLTQLGEILIDGHHAAHAAQSFNTISFPVRIVEDWTHIKATKILKELQKNKKAYFIDVSGKFSPVDSFSQMQDDPNRYLASILAKKDPDQSESCPEIPKIWYKPNNAAPFIEFMIADVFYKHHFYLKDEWLSNFPSAQWKKAKEILVYEKENSTNDVLRNLLIVN